MKYLKIYESFMDSRNSGILADIEAGEIENDEIYSNMDIDTNFGIEESQFGKEEILAKWQEKFNDMEPTMQDKYDFYHDLREQGFDGILIFDTLGDRMNNTESNEQDEYFTENSNEVCDPCGDEDNQDNQDNETEEEISEKCSNCDYTPCKC